MTWPRSLITELARRRCIIFMGAGVSATATLPDGQKPKTWGSFIKEALNLVTDKTQNEEISKLVEDKNYLLALQAIKEEADSAEYTALLDQSYNKKYKASELHELIYRLDSRIVITTNFDKIYENYCESSDSDETGFKVISYYDDATLGNLIRSDTRIIIKAHGNINTIDKMIFTRAEYHKAKKSFSSFYSILRALFITNTCVFIGCSMDDPDINLLLEDVKITSKSTHPHYVLVKKNQHSNIRKKDWKNTYNISTIDYGDNYEDLPNKLTNLVEEVETFRIDNPEA